MSENHLLVKDLHLVLKSPPPWKLSGEGIIHGFANAVKQTHALQQDAVSWQMQVTDELGFFEKIVDRVHHFILPVTCYTIGSFTTLTVLMKNSLIEEIKKDYIRTARAKGVDEKTVYMKHALRNALIPIVTGLGGFLMVFFAGSLLLETIFQLDGIGLLSYKSILSRDYNVIMGLVFIQSLMFLIGNVLSDFAYILVDPRIDFQ